MNIFATLPAGLRIDSTLQSALAESFMPLVVLLVIVTLCVLHWCLGPENRP